MSRETGPLLRVGFQQLFPLLPLSDEVTARMMFLLGYGSVTGAVTALPLPLIDEACDPVIAQVRRLKELEVENARLRRAISDLTLDKLILTEAARGTSKPRPSPGLRDQGHDRFEGLGAVCLRRAGPASLDTAQACPRTR